MTTAEKYITRDLIRKANAGLMTRGGVADRSRSLSPAARGAMPSRKEIVEAGNKALAKMLREQAAA